MSNISTISLDAENLKPLDASSSVLYNHIVDEPVEKTIIEATRITTFLHQLGVAQVVFSFLTDVSPDWHMVTRLTRHENLIFIGLFCNDTKIVTQDFRGNIFTRSVSGIAAGQKILSGCGSFIFTNMSKSHLFAFVENYQTLLVWDLQQHRVVRKLRVPKGKIIPNPSKPVFAIQTSTNVNMYNFDTKKKLFVAKFDDDDGDCDLSKWRVWSQDGNFFFFPTCDNGVARLDLQTMSVVSLPFGSSRHNVDGIHALENQCVVRIWIPHEGFGWFRFDFDKRCRQRSIGDWGPTTKFGSEEGETSVWKRGVSIATHQLQAIGDIFSLDIDVVLGRSQPNKLNKLNKKRARNESGR